MLHTIFTPHPDAKAEFGRSVALTANGDIIVGAWEADVDDFDSAGRVNLFDGNTGNLVLDIPNPDPESSAAFGWSVAALGEKIVVGAPYSRNLTQLPSEISIPSPPDCTTK